MQYISYVSIVNIYLYFFKYFLLLFILIIIVIINILSFNNRLNNKYLKNMIKTKGITCLKVFNNLMIKFTLELKYQFKVDRLLFNCC